MFTEGNQATGEERLAAVVVWKGGGMHIERNPIRAFLLRVLALFGKRQRRVQLPPVEDGWARTGSDVRKIEYRKGQGTVRLRGREFTPRDSRTMMLFVAADSDQPGGIRVDEHAIATEVRATWQPDAALVERLRAGDPKVGQQIASKMGARYQENQRYWLDVLNADDRYREFVESAMAEFKKPNEHP